MANERYLKSLIVEILDKQLTHPSRSNPHNSLRADNGEFMYLLMASNLANVETCVATWSIPEEDTAMLVGLHDPTPPGTDTSEPPAPVPIIK